MAKDMRRKSEKLGPIIKIITYREVVCNENSYTSLQEWNFRILRFVLLLKWKLIPKVTINLISPSGCSGHTVYKERSKGSLPINLHVKVLWK